MDKESRPIEADKQIYLLLENLGENLARLDDLVNKVERINNRIEREDIPDEVEKGGESDKSPIAINDILRSLIERSGHTLGRANEYIGTLDRLI